MRWTPLILPSLLAAACGGSASDEAASPAELEPDLPGGELDLPADGADLGPRPVRPDDALTASGNEPFWSIEITPGALALSRLGAPDVDARDPRVERFDDGRVHYVAEQEGILVEVVPALCRDDMTGMPHPLEVTVAFGDTRLAGCGGDPMELLAGKTWEVIELGSGAPPSEGARPTFAFDPDESKIAGQTGCNRFNGDLSLTGEGLSFGPLATTRRACPGPAMDVEQRFLALLGAAIRFDVHADGTLHLIATDGRELVARPAD